jgi:hypothetical protein
MRPERQNDCRPPNRGVQGRGPLSPLNVDSSRPVSAKTSHSLTSKTDPKRSQVGGDQRTALSSATILKQTYRSEFFRAEWTDEILGVCALALLKRT